LVNIFSVQNMVATKRDRPSKFILQVLSGGKRMKSGQIFEELERVAPGRFKKTQIYQSIINLKKSGKIQNDGRIYFTEAEAVVHANAIRQWFYRHPDKRIYDSSLSRRLNIPPESTLEVLEELTKDSFLVEGKRSDFLGREYMISKDARRDIPPTIQNAEAIHDTIADVRERLTELVHQIQALEENLLAQESS